LRKHIHYDFQGDNWTTNDLFKFQHDSLEDYDAAEKRVICEEWLRRLNAVPKKYCYLAWYASAIYTCYYRLAPLVVNKGEKKEIWMNAKREYAEIFLMGRRIWRRPTHPTRLRVLYDFATLCVRFSGVPDDDTVVLFRDLLYDYDNFNFEVLSEIEYAQSIEKKASSLSAPESIISDAITFPLLDVPNTKKELTRKPSVRFVEKSDNDGGELLLEGEPATAVFVDQKSEFQKNGHSSKIFTKSVPSSSHAHTLAHEAFTAEFGGQLVIPEIIVSSKLASTAEPVTTMLTTSENNETEKEFMAYKKPESGEINRTLPLIVAKAHLSITSPVFDSMNNNTRQA
uniref:BUB1 N-terminal domain-containing protein n=1 Tax=Gongylonema pulchrum TaxID=637853 RepID=A0A183DQH6_9BILA